MFNTTYNPGLVVRCKSFLQTMLPRPLRIIYYKWAFHRAASRGLKSGHSPKLELIRMCAIAELCRRDGDSSLCGVIEEITAK